MVKVKDYAHYLRELQKLKKKTDFIFHFNMGGESMMRVGTIEDVGEDYIKINALERDKDGNEIRVPKVYQIKDLFELG